ncbi:MAG: FKBP-type peptidyl-prolyl cis-trans isomerase [bacterium]|nr:FKBP-type peptidyl-prolyl cis-trans isomerase [bacterium]
MKSLTVFCLLAVSGAGLAFAQAEKPESLEDRASYAIGLNLGRSLVAQGVSVNVDLLSRGVRDAVGGGETLLSDQEMNETMQALQTKVQQEQQAKFAAMAEENRAAGEALLASNAGADNVTTTASGLQYKVLTEGEGGSPAAADQVRVHYEGRLVDGNVFDSSYDRGEPVEFQLGGVIPGWIEALPLMKVGSKWRLWIPSALAYGEQGRPPQIGPNSTLVFDVELLGIVPAASDG